MLKTYVFGREKHIFDNCGRLWSAMPIVLWWDRDSKQYLEIRG